MIGTEKYQLSKSLNYHNTQGQEKKIENVNNQTWRNMAYEEYKFNRFQYEVKYKILEVLINLIS